MQDQLSGWPATLRCESRQPTGHFFASTAISDLVEVIIPADKAKAVVWMK
jgi:hypothetical protein